MCDSPGWYHHLFTTEEDVTARWLTAVAGVLRAEDLPVSTAHVIEAVRLADALAALRGRASAGLAEVTEATLAVLCGGDEVQLDLVTRKLVVGERMGAVPDDAPLTPLAADLAATVRRLRLKRDPLPRELDLDLRTPGGLERSRLLHRLRLLGIPWGRPAASARRSTGTFRETLGDRLAAGVRGGPGGGRGARHHRAPGRRPRASAPPCTDAPALTDVTSAVERCLLADLPDALPDALGALDARAAGDADVAHLMAAFPALARATRYGDVRGTDTAALRTVADRMLARICAGLPPAAHGIDDDEAARLSGLVDGVHGVTGLLGEAATDRWLMALTRLADRPALPSLLAGRLARVLADTDRMAPDEVERRLSRALTAGTPAAQAGAYVEGFFAGGALLLVHDDRLLRLVDRWLAGSGGRAVRRGAAAAAAHVRRVRRPGAAGDRGAGRRARPAPSRPRASSRGWTRSGPSWWCRCSRGSLGWAHD